MKKAKIGFAILSILFAFQAISQVSVNTFWQRAGIYLHA